MSTTPVTSTGSTPSAPSAASSTATVLGQTLDRNAFLKLLVTQLQNQDPTKPMDDEQFIAQMAQFSSLEQMTNVSSGVAAMAQSQGNTQALALVGRTVDLQGAQGGAAVTGRVDEVRLTSTGPQLVVSGKTYGLADLVSVHG